MGAVDGCGQAQHCYLCGSGLANGARTQKSQVPEQTERVL